MYDEGSFIWENYYDVESRICDFYITLFEECDDGRYERFDETQSERMYTLSEMKKHLEAAGFELLGAYSDFDFNEGTDDNERIYLVARCIKN